MKLSVLTQSEGAGLEFHSSFSIGCESEWAGAGMTRQPIREQRVCVSVGGKERE